MATSTSTSDISRKDYVFAITIIGLFFFIFGFVTWLNGVLIPFLRTACELNDFQAYFVTAAFYISYFVMALPSSVILKKTGFKIGMSLGLWVMAVGALVFIPAALSRAFWLFLTGLFIQGTGLALLQTAVNPYVTIIGPRESAAKRISIMGIANKFAGVIAPIILASIILKDSHILEEKLVQASDAASRSVLLDEMARNVIMPYIVMAVVLVLLGLLLKFVHLPEVDTEAEDEAVGEANLKKTSIWQFPHLILGVVALFFYVGVEVIAGDTIIRYGQSLGIPMDSAKYFTSLTMLAMIAGYLLGIALIPKYLKQGNALKLCTILGVIFSLGAIFTPADKVFTMPFIDLVTFKSLQLVLPVTVLICCFAWICQFACLARYVAACIGWPWQIHKDSFCHAHYGNRRWCYCAVNLWKTGSGFFHPDSLLDMRSGISYNNVLCIYRTQSRQIVYGVRPEDHI